MNFEVIGNSWTTRGNVFAKVNFICHDTRRLYHGVKGTRCVPACWQPPARFNKNFSLGDDETRDSRESRLSFAREIESRRRPGFFVKAKVYANQRHSIGVRTRFACAPRAPFSSSFFSSPSFSLSLFFFSGARTRRAFPPQEI